MELHLLKPAKGSVKKRKRVGRGEGSGRGGTATRGHNGAQSRSGYSKKRGFSGGQKPLHQTCPKIGFRPVRKKKYDVINLHSIVQAWKKEDNPPKEIGKEWLKKNGLINKNDYKILADIWEDFPKNISIQADACSKRAKEIVIAQKGKIVLIKK